MPPGDTAATEILPLTARQRERLLLALRQAADARLYRRLLALVQVDRGKPVSQVAEELLVSRMTVYRWLRRYLSCRDPWGLDDRAGRGRRSSWTPELQSLLEQALQAPPPERGYRGARWTLCHSPPYVIPARLTQADRGGSPKLIALGSPKLITRPPNAS
jgi:hypothetical protein